MRVPLTGLWLLSSALLTAVPGHARAQTADRAAERSVSDAVYSSAQAARGRSIFSSVCAQCHTSGQFKGSAFLGNWVGRSVHALFEQIRTTMPNDDPGGMSREEYAAVVAYFLQLNEFPAGTTNLPSDDAALKEIRFDSKADSTGAR
jgi:mono/diheme cytochrome c family protein